MGSVQRNPNGDCIETSAEQLLSSDSPDFYNVFGDPELHPRIGEDYQVEIPILLSKHEKYFYKICLSDFRSKSNRPCDFLIGLPIPIMHTNKELESANDKSVDNAFENGNNLGKLADFGWGKEKKRKAYQKFKSQGHCLLPGLVETTWTGTEEACFLLGLYIFGKDLSLVKTFVDSKTMGDIQGYYYGKFYKSSEYRRWSDCRKVRSRRCVYGHKIFSGTRQHELLSRLFFRVSAECQNNLSEVSKNFSEGQLTLNDYVLTLKALVGVNNFVDAVGIGKGKRDLTSITMEPQKPIYSAPSRSDLPSGKACSSLTREEIMKCLTGGYRLSKARSNDLFWEAVWPRLLARGWHSEQPKDQIYAFGSKGSLVFLMPGVKKFSRRKLVKGNQYFDCVTDVLSKVSSDPSLLELDNEGCENSGNKEEEDGWSSKDRKPDYDDMTGHRRHCYLQPRTPNRGKGVGVMKFTVVDTSMGDGKVYKLRELKTLPDEVWNTSIASETNSEESDETKCDVSSENSDLEDTALIDQDCNNSPQNTKMISSVRVLFQEKHIVETDSAIEEAISPDSEEKAVKRIREEEEDIDWGSVKKPKKCYQGLKKGNQKYLSPITKRHRKLSSCTQSIEARDLSLKPSVGITFEQERRVSCSDTTDSSENNQINSFPKSEPSPEFPQPDFLKHSSFEGSQNFACETDVCPEESSDKPQTRTFDLNLPQVSPEIECEVEKNIQISKPEKLTASESTEAVTSSDQQSNVNSRRQSTRNRPLTMKALEALANGYLTINTRKKRKEVGPKKTSSSRSQSRANGGTECTEDSGSVSEDTQIVEGDSGTGNIDSDSYGKFQVFPEENAAQNLC